VRADAFYEWQKIDSKTKQPFAIALKTSEPYAVAGLWERWRDTKAGTALRSFAIVTTDPNAVVQPLHNRMPVIVPERDYGRWLSTESSQPPSDLLRPFDADKMIAWKVDKAVGNVKNDSPERGSAFCLALRLLVPHFLPRKLRIGLKCRGEKVRYRSLQW
jgi:putative SOS response-associated peptidase YedK